MSRLTIADKIRRYAPPPTGLGEECPRIGEHTKGAPEGYIAKREWAEKMLKTHRQLRCEGCGLYKVWVPK